MANFQLPAQSHWAHWEERCPSPDALIHSWPQLRWLPSNSFVSLVCSLSYSLLLPTFSALLKPPASPPLSQAGDVAASSHRTDLLISTSIQHSLLPSWMVEGMWLPPGEIHPRPLPMLWPLPCLGVHTLPHPRSFPLYWSFFIHIYTLMSLQS